MIGNGLEAPQGDGQGEGRGEGQGEALALQAQRLAVLLEVTRGLLQGGHDEAALARTAFEKAGACLEADAGFNYRLDRDTGTLELVAGFGLPPPLLQAAQRIRPGQSYCARVAASGRRFAAEAAAIAADADAELLRRLGVRAYACHPLLDGDGRLLGTFSLASTRRERFTAADLDFLQTLGHFIAMAWERLRTERALGRAAQEMKRAQALSSVGSWRLMLPSCRLEWSDEVYRIFGLPPGHEIDYAGFLARVHPEDRARVETGFGNALAGRQPYDLEHRIFVDRRLKWVREKAELERDAQGRVQGAFGTVQDVTERKRMEAALRESEEGLRATFEQAGVGIVHLDAGGRFLRANRKYCEMLGRGEEELRRLTYLDLTAEADRESSRTSFERLVRGEQQHLTVEKRYLRRDGEPMWVRITASAVRDAGSGAFKYEVAIVEDITAHRLAEQRARDAALHDPLTGLPNRRLVFEYAEHLLAAAARQHSRGAFLFIDLDRFKPVNDLYGHEVGDRLLEEVARRLLGCVRHADVVGRLGGDEFLILLPHLQASEHAETVARHVIERVSAPVAIRELSVSVSPSIGIALFPEHGLDADALVHAADLAMYQAKQSGPGSHRVYTSDLAQLAHHRSSVEARLKRALERSGLRLHYQPVIDMRTGRPSGAEALLRLAGEADAEEAAQGPSRFIPVAESAGLMGALGDWVAAEACRQHAAWRAAGLPPIPISINVSPLQFRQRDFVQRLTAIAREAGVDPSFLQVEVTESTVMDHVAEAVETLQALRAAGIRVALDDFGTGYSSLSQLGHLPIDRLKVDQSFVRRLDHDRASRAITEAVLALARTLALEVVGEGIESEQALAYLHAHGCHQGQGYFFSRPLPQDEFARWWRHADGH